MSPILAPPVPAPLRDVMPLLRRLAIERPGGEFDFVTPQAAGEAVTPWILPAAGSSELAAPLPGLRAWAAPGDGDRFALTLDRPGGSQLATVLPGPGAGTRIDYTLDLPSGATLIHEFSADAVYLRGAQNEFLGGAAAPWAMDARGIPINTYFVVAGRGLSQVIEPRAEHSYPFLVDPLFGRRLIAGVRWSERDPRGRTLEVRPTFWNRITMNNPWAIRSGWEEVIALMPEADTEQLFWQYRCHQQFAPIKRSWNLDEWIVRESYLDSFRHLCN
ncbi:DUF2599 domain-containing protein [Mycetocola spongiae]|uniref:DUF2599 domain-containing protein n=1 Tax=Mycetocola spongiae TaxID=2859226 RepID=UPI001CF464AD|nr:DUF2599 domain-containing protein [Mycetocola spongiae]UCR90233.1 DUF2599 domain-containing protein [Mycetocola spongiae]